MPPSPLARLKLDPFTLALLGTVTVATVLPARGGAAAAFGGATTAAIALLFFLHGARLSREAIVAGVGHWRLHLTVLASTFLLFPLMGLLVGLVGRAAPAGWVPGAVADGVLFLCLLPSTVQSSIAFTSIAGGSVPAAVCGASASNLIGIALTPLLAGWLMGARGVHGSPVGAAIAIVLQLLVPFVAGHLSRPLTAAFVERNKRWMILVDRGSILMVVYTAFSAAVVEGLWRRLGVGDLAVVFALDAAILAAALLATTWGARRLGFSRPDEIAIVFCGSKKSLASGVPMAGVLFPAAKVGVLIVPLMIFHQMQLMVCAALARRYAARAASDAAVPTLGPAPAPGPVLTE